MWSQLTSKETLSSIPPTLQPLTGYTGNGPLEIFVYVTQRRIEKEQHSCSTLAPTTYRTAKGILGRLNSHSQPRG